MSFSSQCARPEVGSGLGQKYTELLGAWRKDGQLPLVYSKSYDISFWGLEKLHPFDPCKYGKVQNLLKDRGHLTPSQAVCPLPVSDEVLYDVHSEEYVKKVSTSSWAVASICELAPLAIVPNFLVQSKVLVPMRTMTAGTMLAAGLAIDCGWAINLGGGMHHASQSQGMGWCVFDDHLLALRALRRLSNGAIQKCLYIDLDAHQGNGVSGDKLTFKDKDLYILDMYNCQVFPQDRAAERGIDIDVRLKSGTGDQQYLSRLSDAMSQSFKEFEPDIVMYNAEAAKVSCGEQMVNLLAACNTMGRIYLQETPWGGAQTRALLFDGGGWLWLMVSAEGIVRRDELVFRACLEAGAPVCMALSGGYAKDNARVIADSLSNLFEKFELSSAGKAADAQAAMPS